MRFNMKSVVMPIAGVNMVMFILQLVIPGLTKVLMINSDFLLSRPWILVSHMFIHDTTTYAHIFFNMFALLMFGPLLEQRIGPNRFLIMYFGSGIFAGIMFSLFSPGVFALGASGAIMGLLGTLIILMPRLKLLLFFVIPMPLYMAGILWAIMDLFGAFGGYSGVGNVAHLAGMFAGLMYGLYAKKKGRKYQRSFVKKAHLDDADIDEYMRSGRI